MRALVLTLIFAGFTLSGWSQALTLDAIIAKVLEQNFDIRIVKNNVAIADNNNNIANAGYLPSIIATADQNWSANNTRQEFFSGVVNQANGAKNKSTNASLRLNWTFFDGFKMFATDQRLQLQEDAAGLQLTAQMEMKIYQAAVLYFTILQQQELQTVYKQAIDLSVARYNLIDLKFKNGAGTRLQLIQARLDLTADSSQLLIQQKQISDLKADLNTVMGQPVSTPLDVSGTITAENTLSWENALSQAKAQNTQLLLAKSAIAISEMQRKEVQSLYYPQLTFYAQYTYATSKSQIGLVNSNRSEGPGAGFTFRWTILDHLSTYNNLRNNSLSIQSAEIVAQQQEQFIESELSKSYNEYLWAKENLRLEQQNIVDAQQTFDIAEQSFKGGSLTSLELREIQFSIVEAQSRLLTAQLSLKTAELNISLSTGNFQTLLTP